jgi:long-chain acyl-CoA synthetase
MLRRAAEEFQGHTAVVAGELRMTYSELTSAISALSRQLVDSGAADGRVAVIMSNGAAIVVALYAIWEAGAQAVPLNPDYTEREIGEILGDAEVHVVICGSPQNDRLGPLLSRSSRTGLMVLDDSGISGLMHASTPLCQAMPHPDAPAILQYTGGTTGRAKGVMLTHRMVAVNVVQRDERIPMRRGAERILCVTPLYHAYATAMALFPALSSGGALVILGRFKPEAVFDAIEREAITLFAGAPAIYNAMVAHPEFELRELSSLSESFSGSAPLAVDVLQRWQRVSGAPILEGYGLTEASPILTFNPREGVCKPGSVGPAVAGTEIDIVDPVTGAPLAGGEAVGEVRARGPQLMAGYRNRPDETADAIRNGWLYTGDLGELDEDGYLFIRGRKKEMAIVGGFNVYPREIEEVVFGMSGVKDCGAIGVKDSYRGEVVHLFIVRGADCRLAEEDVLAHCAKNLVRYKVPARVRFVDEMPRTPVGKLDRIALATLAADLVREAP